VASGLVLGFTVVGGPGVLGFVRALTVQIWESNHWIVRQATGLTMMCLVGCFAGPARWPPVIGSRQGTANLETASFLLYWP